MRGFGAATVAIAGALLDAGADPEETTLGPPASTTMGLVITSHQASDANLSAPLIDVLRAHGAALDLTTPGVLDAPLSNHAPRAAEAMIALGAPVDLCAAAALGDLARVQAAFDERGRLRERIWRRGRRSAAARSGRPGAALRLCQSPAARRRRAVRAGRRLERDRRAERHRAAPRRVDGRSRDGAAADRARRRPVEPRQPVHRDGVRLGGPQPADGGRRLAAGEGAGRSARRSRARPDRRREARLRDDPDAANRRRDHWNIPAGTPLHWAAARNRPLLARVLLAYGADPNAADGRGRTPLDYAAEQDATAVTAILVQHGGRRSGLE